MNRRTFVNLTALGGAVLVLPSALGGCGSAGGDGEALAKGVGPVPGPPGEPSPASPSSTSPSAPAARSVAGKAMDVCRVGSGGAQFDLYGLDNRVDFLSSTGAVERSVTQGFNYPASLAVTSDGRALVLDLGSASILPFDLTGRSLGAFARGTSFAAPRDIAIFAGTVAVADSFDHRIVLLSEGGALRSTLGSLGSGQGKLNAPSSVAYGPDGSLYVADTGNARVVVYSPAGSVRATLGARGTAKGQFVSPTSVRVDASGLAYVADPGNGQVSVLDATGKLVERFQPTLPDGTPGTALWVSNQIDGSILVGAVAAGPA